MKSNDKLPDDFIPVIPGFDAVAESRKWKEAVGREIAGMTSAERVAYFNDFGKKYFAGQYLEDKRAWERLYGKRDAVPQS